MPIDRDAQLKRLREAGERWQARSAARTATGRLLAEGGPVAAETQARLRAHVQWRSETLTRSPIIAFERAIGVINFADLPPSAEAGVAARSVARIIEMPQGGFEPQGFGTGFMVAPGLLMTNNHVLPDFDSARHAAANFGHAKASGRIASGTVERFSRDPDQFVTDEKLDFSMIALERDPEAGFHPLIGAIGKILLGQEVGIIQHPSGGVRKYAVKDSILVDLLPDFLHYTTDTEPGSSGSPAFNNHWELVALHHQGVPNMRGGVILAKGGGPWDSRTMEDADIDWVANEGARVSRIVERLQALHAEQPKLRALINRALSASRLAPVERLAASIPFATAASPMALQGGAMNATTIHIHAPTIIYTAGGEPRAGEQTGAALLPAVSTTGAPSLDAPEGISIDPDYAARAGYAPAFLGNGSDIPLPTIPASMRAEIAPLLNGNIAGVLNYHHFSIVMHATRKLAIYTAVNIDGKRGKRPAREDDKWFFDPRLDRSHQIGEELYRANPLDRGHLVRRLDPAWGAQKMAKVANDDTFHFTNCSPQHSSLNQKIWVDLEDYLLDHAQEADALLTVFTGPVFLEDDDEYRGVQLPRRFWKVAVMHDLNGDLLAAGFVQTQSKMIAGLKEDFLRQQTRTDQFKVSQIEDLTGLAFNIAPAADALHGEQDALIPEALGMSGRRLRTLEDIKLR